MERFIDVFAGGLLNVPLGTWLNRYGIEWSISLLGGWMKRRADRRSAEWGSGQTGQQSVRWTDGRACGYMCVLRCAE